LLELNIKCESLDEARVYLNAHNYLNLISDFYQAIYTARKHGTNADVLDKIEYFLPDFSSAIDNSQGAY
jgi:hypothetical protein